jgi:hypothetical protein
MSLGKLFWTFRKITVPNVLGETHRDEVPQGQYSAYYTGMCGDECLRELMKMTVTGCGMVSVYWLGYLQHGPVKALQCFQTLTNHRGVSV